MPGPHQVTADVLAGPDQVPGGLLGDRGDPDRDDLSDLQQLGQQQRVLGVGLDPVTGRPGQLRGRGDLAADPRRGDRPVQAEPGRAGLIGGRDRARQAPAATR